MAQSFTPLSTPLFPGTVNDPFFITSQPTDEYNCIALAYEDPSRWYWPDYKGFWPAHIPREVTLAAFQLLFENAGYRICPGDSIEAGFQKIAIYVDSNNIPTHAARQMPDGTWTSKLGQWFDVTHTVQNMDDGNYGKIAIIMSRKIPG